MPSLITFSLFEIYFCQCTRLTCFQIWQQVGIVGVNTSNVVRSKWNTMVVTRFNCKLIHCWDKGKYTAICELSILFSVRCVFVAIHNQCIPSILIVTTARPFYLKPFNSRFEIHLARNCNSVQQIYSFINLTQ